MIATPSIRTSRGAARMAVTTSSAALDALRESLWIAVSPLSQHLLGVLRRRGLAKLCTHRDRVGIAAFHLAPNVFDLAYTP